MEKRCAEDSERRPLKPLIEDTLEYLKRLEYAEKTVQEFRGHFMKLVDFANDKTDGKFFSQDMVKRFMESKGIPFPYRPGLTGSKHRISHSMRILSEFATQGFHKRRRDTTQRIQLPLEQEKILEGYEKFSITQRGMRETSTRTYRSRIADFLQFINSRGVMNISDIEPCMFFDYMVAQKRLNPKTLSLSASYLRSFLRYLSMQGIILEDLSPHIPSVRIWKNEEIPSVWNADDVERILAAVDRGRPKGKRDYAILLLAARLGLRAGDIIKLRFENLLWDNAHIEIRQAKNCRLLALPLTEEVGSALIDYIQHGRPESRRKEIFLRAVAPYEPFSAGSSLSSIFKRYQRLAGIKPKRECRRGIHSLRHTLATRLLESGAALETIADVLGHTNIDSTRVYTKVNIEMLRTAAIDVEVGCHA